MARVTTFYEENLIATVDKKSLLGMLRQWRHEETTKLGAEILTDVIEAVSSGEFDG